MKPLPLLPAILLALPGCVHRPAPTVFIREVPVQVVSSNAALDAIRFPASYRAYTVGRRMDSANPELMQEAHIIYVRESTDRWNLHPAPAGVPLPSGGHGSVDAAFVPLALDEQVRFELNEQTQRLQQASDALVPAARKLFEFSAQGEARLQQFEDRLRRLDGSQRMSSFTNWSSNTNRKKESSNK